MVALASHHLALIHLGVIMAGCDGEISTAELQAIGRAVEGLPAFDGFEADALIPAAEQAASEVAPAADIEAALATALERLPPGLAETAFVIAAEVALADGLATPEERRVLQVLSRRLGLSPLVSAALEFGVEVRFRPRG